MRARIRWVLFVVFIGSSRLIVVYFRCIYILFFVLCFLSVVSIGSSVCCIITRAAYIEPTTCVRYISGVCLLFLIVVSPLVVCHKVTSIFDDCLLMVHT